MADKASSTEVAVKPTKALPNHVVNPKPLPPELSELFDLRTWFDSLINKTPYTEKNSEHMAERMLMLTLLSETPDQVMTPQTLTGLQDIVPNSAGASTGPITIDELYVAKSDQEEGNPCFMVFGYTEDTTGIHTTTSTGATQLQAQFATLLAMGVWPIKGQIKRTERMDKGKRYLFFFFPND